MSAPPEQSENENVAMSADEDFKVPSIPIRTEEEKEEETVKNETIENRGDARTTEEIPYTPPEWRLQPPSSPADCFYIEVIKNGTIVDVVRLHDLRCDTFITVGRFPPCELQLDHPSVSRYHCVLQYGRVANRDCWTVYDLGSTHGTRLNKQPVKRRAYVPLRPGYVLQFAGSTRIFSFCGPSDEETDELAQSTAAASSAKADDAMANANAAVEEEEGDGAKYYEKDPLGYLDKYFEREGAPMSFQYARAEKGATEWSCSIELPDFPENEALVAGTGVTRKLAQVQCALLACRQLHTAGLLNVVSLWNKRVSYAENDYYDSDEDTYLDRTGQIEAQRIKRRRRLEGSADGSSSSGSLTFDELTKSLAVTEEKLKNIAVEIQRLLGKNCYADADGQLVSTSSNFSTRMALSQMRGKEKRFAEERDQLRRLVEVTRPRRLDDIMPIVRPSATAASFSATVEDVSLAAVNKEEPTSNEKNSNHRAMKKDEPATANEIFPLSPKRPVAEIASHLQPAETVKDERKAESLKDDTSTKKEDDKETTEARPVRVYRPIAPPSSARVAAKETVIMPKYGLISREEARVKHPTLTKRRPQRVADEEDEEGPEEKRPHHADYSDAKYAGREDYATWLPPQDQTGDGTTKLNKKFEGRY